MTEKITARKFENAVNKMVELRELDAYRDGSIAVLDSLKDMFLDSTDKTIKIKTIVEEFIPGFINVVNEHHARLKKEITNKFNNDDRDDKQLEEVSLTTKYILN